MNCRIMLTEEPACVGWTSLTEVCVNHGEGGGVDLGSSLTGDVVNACELTRGAALSAGGEEPVRESEVAARPVCQVRPAPSAASSCRSNVCIFSVTLSTVSSVDPSQKDLSFSNKSIICRKALPCF